MCLGIHRFNIVRIEYSNLVSTVTGSRIYRFVKECEKCGKIKYDGFELGIDYNDGELFNPILRKSK